MKRKVWLSVFASAVLAGAGVAATLPASAAYFLLEGSTCDGSTNVNCMTVDSTALVLKHNLVWMRIYGWDDSTSGQTIAKACNEFWDGISGSCGPSKSTLVGGTGAYVLAPDRTWFSGGVQRGWTSANADDFGYVNVNSNASGQYFQGIAFTW